MPALILALALAAPAAPQPAHEQPAVTRDPEGGFTVHRPIEAEKVTVRDATGGLIADWQPAHDGEAEELERAFEGAVDQARSVAPRP